MMEDAGEDVLRQKPSMVVTFFKRIGQVRLKVVLDFPCNFNLQTYQLMLDRWTPYTTSRWVFTVVLCIAFMARILLAQVIEVHHNAMSI